MSVVWFLLAGCGGPVLPEPTLDAVVPSFAWNGEPETLSLVGAHFFPQLEVDIRSGDASVNPTYRAFLVGPDGGAARHELFGVGIVDEHHLTATMDVGLAPGRYDVAIEGPTGRSAVLSEAFRVTDEQAAQLTLRSVRAVYDVAEEAEVTIELLDLGGERVDLPLEIAVVAVPELTDTEVVFEPGSLGSAVPTPDGDGLRGVVEGGRVVVRVRPAVPDRLTLSVVPWDPASNVVGDTMQLTFEPGDDLTVAFDLPPDTTEVIAGETLVVTGRVEDQYGNRVDDPIPVTLRTTCSGWVGEAVLEGDTPILVVPRLATTPFCDRDRVEVLQPTALNGLSDGFVVLPGPTEHFLVLANPVRPLAGDEIEVLVDPEDAFGNRSDWSGELTLQDSEDGLVSSSCQVFASTTLCTGIVTRAAPAVTVFAIGDDGTTGSSNTIEVLPDDVPGAIRVDAPPTWVAGEPVPVWVHLLDAWDNEMDTSVLGVGAVTLADELGDASCLHQEFEPGGAERFLCVANTARPDAVLEATLGTLTDTTDVEVVNGELAEVLFAVPATGTAGVDLSIQLSGRDAFGNPYVEQSDPVVELADESGSLDLAEATLGPLGNAAVAASVTRSGTTRLLAFRGGVEVGRSSAIAIAPAATTDLRVTSAEPWAWVGTDVAVQVETVDTFGNRTDQALVATVGSAFTSSPDVSVPLVNGVGTAPFSWTEAAWPDRLVATSGPWNGETTLLVARSCGLGPRVDIEFAGDPEAIACVDGAGDAVITADLSGSLRGFAPLAAFAVAVDDEPAVAGAQPLLTAAMHGIGHHRLRALTIDDFGCGDETEADGWAGPDDGSPVGPVVLASTATELDVVDSVTVTIEGVVDCARDPASFGRLLVSTTAGDLPQATPTGAGLEESLDLAGDGVFTLRTQGQLAETSARVMAFVATGAAAGRLDLPVVGDNVRPVVFGSTPSGHGTGALSSIDLEFSEALLSGTAVPANFAVIGPTAVNVSDVDLVGSRVTLSLSPPLDRSLGAYTITASSSVRDLAGNRLSGDWSGAPGTWVGGVGGVGSPPSKADCDAFDPETLEFRPDGDDGEGVESDRFDITVSSATLPAWWVMRVVDGTGALVQERWTVPVSTIDHVEWDGRGLDGAVVDDGTFAISVEADDGFGNRGAGCVTSVTVDVVPAGVE